jgi:GNAT superfamily N-acetyltransferase
MKVMSDIRFTICEEDPGSPDAAALMDELSDFLESVTGRSGRASFDPKGVRVPRGVFVVARDDNGAALGCGALRPMDETIAEIKRMYARNRSRGVGGAMLKYLEQKAREYGFNAVWLETGLENEKAVAFYERSGYKRIPNFGIYAGRNNSVCFEKRL